MSYPIHLHRAQRLDVRVGPGERDAHPEADENAEQLDHVSVGHGVEASKEGVEDRDACAEDYRCLLVHVDDDCQSCSCGTKHYVEACHGMFMRKI